MKNTLQVLMKKDIKALLPGIVMFIIAGIALFVMAMLGVFTDNGDFTVTVLYVFIMAIMGVLVYNVVKGANLYRINLSDEEYMAGIEERGLTPKSFALGKMISTWIITTVTFTVYAVGLVISAVLAFHRLSGASEEISKNSLFNALNELSQNIDFLTVFLSCIAVVATIAGITAFVYLAFELCYKYFIRGRYAFIASIMTMFCMFWVIWKIFDFIVPESGIASIAGTAVYAAIICIICVLIHLATAPKEKLKTIDK